MPSKHPQGIRGYTRLHSAERAIAAAMLRWIPFNQANAARRVELAERILRRARKIEGERVYAAWDGETLLVSSDEAAIIRWAEKRGGVRLLDVSEWRRP